MFGIISNRLSAYFPTWNINCDLLISTLFFFILGLCYYIYKFYKASEVISERVDNNNRLNHNNNNNFDSHNNELTIYVQIREERKRFVVKKTDIIRDFIIESIKPLTDNREVDLIFQGMRLDKNKPFDYYSRRIINDSVIICVILQGNWENRNNERNGWGDYQEENSANSVSAFALLVHLIILVIAIFLIGCYKKYKEIFTPETVKVIQIMLICWAFFLSGTLTKLFYYKTVVF